MRFSRISAIIAIFGYSYLPCANAKAAAGAVEWDQVASDETSDTIRGLQEASSFSILAGEMAAWKGEKSGKSSKSGKSGKSAKAGKAGSSAKSSKGDGNGITGRFGPQLSPSRIAQEFDFSNNTQVITSGLQLYGPDRLNFSLPTVDSLSTFGLALTFEDAISICVTRCHENDRCKAVRIDSPAPVAPPSLVNLDYFCTMYDPSLGPGVFKYISHFADSGLPGPVLYTKRDAKPIERIPDFEPCDILVPQVPTLINCALVCPQVPAAPGCDSCPASFSDDFLTYILPAAQCAAEAGGPDFLNTCLTCLNTPPLAPGGVAGAAAVCTSDLNNNYITATGCGGCGDACYVNVTGSGQTLDEIDPECLPKLQTAVLCATGSIPVAVSNGPDVIGFGGNAVNFPYVCPAE